MPCMISDSRHGPRRPGATRPPGEARRSTRGGGTGTVGPTRPCASSRGHRGESDGEADRACSFSFPPIRSPGGGSRYSRCRALGRACRGDCHCPLEREREPEREKRQQDGYRPGHACACQAVGRHVVAAARRGPGPCSDACSMLDRHGHAWHRYHIYPCGRQAAAPSVHTPRPAGDVRAATRYARRP